ncbi:MAG: alanine dehydrogenase [Hadesarchaea archaeon]|nr:alanine dehydrogenase [Hadesarchaea archaeon]
MKVLLLSRAEVEGLISMREAIEAVEQAFRAKGLGKIQMPAKSYVYFKDYNGDFRVMPAYLEEMGAAGVKIVNAHPRNPKEYGLPTVMATIVLLDPKTGAPLAIMDGTWITNIRTGAGGAVAAKYLARKDSRVAAMVGAGVQAKTQLLALNEVLKIEEVRVNDLSVGKAEKYAKEMGKKLGLDTKATKETRKAVEGADIVVTTTPSRRPVLMNNWVSEGMHINAIGADAPGKQELDPEILMRAKVVVDDVEQAIHGGEVNVPLSKGLIARGDIYADLGEIVTKKKPGRTSHDEITVFDSTGLAVQDIATDWIVYKKAKRMGKGREVELL